MADNNKTEQVWTVNKTKKTKTIKQFETNARKIKKKDLTVIVVKQNEI